MGKQAPPSPGNSRRTRDDERECLILVLAGRAQANYCDYQPASIVLTLRFDSRIRADLGRQRCCLHFLRIEVVESKYLRWTTSYSRWSEDVVGKNAVDVDAED